MSKVTIVQVVYNSKKFMQPVFDAIFKQTVADYNVVAVISGNDDGGKEFLIKNFPKVEIIDPGYNIGFAKGHNLVFSKYNSDFFQLVNPDMIMEPNYIEQMLKAFNDPKVGAATGKLYQVSSDKFQIPADEFNIQKDGFKTFDTTGVVISKSGRARDRGQHEVDNGQYDSLTNVQAVSAAGSMYRRSALAATSCALPSGNIEFFDEDFHSYWEDVDLAWRMSNSGWKNIFVPAAVGYHGRGAGSSKGGYVDVLGFIKHHKTLSLRIRKLNYQNHIFMYIKNSRVFYPQFFIREFFMFFYTLIFEPDALQFLPEFFKTLPKIWKKRKLIQNKT